MTMNHARTSSEAEAEAEQARAGLVSTLSQLRDNLQPAQVVEEVMAKAKISAAAVSEQIWDTARKNPLPALMIGAGIAMMLGLGRQAAGSGAPRSPPIGEGRERSLNRGFEDAAHIARPGLRTLQPEPSPPGAAYASVKAPADDLLGAANDRLASAAAGTVSAIGKTVQPGTKGDAMAYTKRDELMSRMSKVIEEQPLILAAIGIAVGAAIGAAIPQTETENSLLGEGSHSVREAAQGLVQDQYAQLKSAASDAADDTKQTVANHGVTSENLSGLVHEVGEKAKAATYDAGKTLDPSI